MQRIHVSAPRIIIELFIAMNSSTLRSSILDPTLVC